MKWLLPLLGLVLLAGCAKKIETKTVTVNHTKTVKVPGPPKQTITVASPPRTITVPAKPPERPRHPLPPTGVYQVGDKTFLVRPGYEANMHHLCDGVVGDNQPSHNYVSAIKGVNSDFVLDCAYSVGKRYADLPFTSAPIPQTSFGGPLYQPDDTFSRWVRRQQDQHSGSTNSDANRRKDPTGSGH